MEEYGAGDLVLVTQPWIWSLTDTKLNELCSHCLRDLPTARDRIVPAITCAGCNVVQFCCSQCQMEANNAYHADECIYIRRLARLPGLTSVFTRASTSAGDDNDSYFYISRLMLRMMFRILHGDTYSLEFFEDDRFNRDFFTLVSHWDEHIRHDFTHQRIISRLLWAMKSVFDIKLNDADRRVETDMLHCAKRSTGDSTTTTRVPETVVEVKTEEVRSTTVRNGPSTTKNQNELSVADRQRLQDLLTLEMFGPLYARVSINSIAIQNMEFEKLGGAVYLSASVFDHSCAPNASRCFNGRELVVRAIQSIQCLDDVRIAYVDVLMPTWKRQEALKMHYFFQCACPRCASAEDEKLLYGVKCPFAAAQPATAAMSPSSSKFLSANSSVVIDTVKKDDDEVSFVTANNSIMSVEATKTMSTLAGGQCRNGEFKLLPRNEEISQNSVPSPLITSHSTAAAAIKRKAAPHDIASRSSSVANLATVRSSTLATPAAGLDASDIVCPLCLQHVPLQYVHRVTTLCSICSKVMLAYDVANSRCAEIQQKHIASAHYGPESGPPSLSAAYDAVNQQATQMQRVAEQAERYLGPHHELLLELRDRLAAYCMHRGEFNQAYTYYSKTLPTVARLLNSNTITHEYATQLMRTATAAYRSTTISSSDALRLAVKSLELQAFLFGADCTWFKEWSRACLSMEARLRAGGQTAQPEPYFSTSLIAAALADQSLRAAAYTEARKSRDFNDESNNKIDTIFMERLLAIKDIQHAEELSKQQKAAALAASMAAAAAAAAAERWVRTMSSKNNTMEGKKDAPKGHEGSISSTTTTDVDSMPTPEPTMRPFSSKKPESVRIQQRKLSALQQRRLFAARTIANKALLLNKPAATGKLTVVSSANTAPTVAALKIMKKASTRLPDAVHKDQRADVTNLQRANANLRLQARQERQDTGGRGPDSTATAGGGGGDNGHVAASLVEKLQSTSTWVSSVESYRVQEAINDHAARETAVTSESVAKESLTTSVKWVKTLPTLESSLSQLSLSQTASDFH